MRLTTLPPAIETFLKPLPGEVEQPITSNSPGRVRFQATSWPARFADPNCHPLLADDPVLVVGRENITLLVLPTDHQPTRQPKRPVDHWF